MRTLPDGVEEFIVDATAMALGAATSHTRCHLFQSARQEVVTLTTMSANLRRYTKAIFGFDHVIRAVRHDQLAIETPCDGWTVDDLVVHATGVLRMVHKHAASSELPPLPDDARTAWAEARDGVLEALDQPGVLHAQVTTPFGPMPVDNLIGLMFVDTVTHTWDLARAIGADERLDSDSIAAADTVLRPIIESLRRPGGYGPAIPPSATDSDQDCFLKHVGRDPAWPHPWVRGSKPAFAVEQPRPRDR